MNFFTIGVFNSSEKQFFDKLLKNEIDTFCDIRQRRGVRGANYAFVNSVRLQQKLATLNIRYLHLHTLAPTAEIRRVQKDADAEKEEANTSRQSLSEPFVNEYTKKILDVVNYEELFSYLKILGAHTCVFFCVEEKPCACHRSLVAKKIGELTGKSIHDL